MASDGETGRAIPPERTRTCRSIGDERRQPPAGVSTPVSPSLFFIFPAGLTGERKPAIVVLIAPGDRNREAQPMEAGR